MGIKEKEKLEENVRLGDISSELQRINNKINSLRNTIGVPFMSEDARQAGLGGIQLIIAPACTWYNTLIALVDRINIKDLPSLLGLPDVPMHETLNRMDGIMRLAIQTGCHFKIEALFYNLLIAIDPQKNIRGFDNLAKELIKKVSINNKEDKLELLRVLGAIRNSYHNNGIHKNSSFTVTIKERKYEFIKEEPVWCASIIDTLIVIEEYVEIVAEILNAEEIKSLSHPVLDIYSSKVEVVSRSEFNEFR